MPADRSHQGHRNHINGRAAERRVTKFFGGERVPLSGASGGSYAGDVLVAGLRLEVKRRRGLPPKRLLDWLAQGNADLLVLLGPGQPVADGLVVMRAETARRLLRGGGRLEGT